MAKQDISLDEIWMIRPCEVYKEEYSDCKRMISRMYQKYVDGQITDCTQWLTDFNNCIAFRKTKDSEAALAVLASEKARQRDRLRKANANNVWEYRKEPPREWFAKLGPKESQNVDASSR